jgi:hypothetical protein
MGRKKMTNQVRQVKISKKREYEHRVNYQGLDDVCLDCGDFIQGKATCFSCGVTALKQNLKINAQE